MAVPYDASAMRREASRCYRVTAPTAARAVTLIALDIRSDEPPAAMPRLLPGVVAEGVLQEEED